MAILNRNGESANGRPPGSDPGSEGSNPSSPAKITKNIAGIPNYIFTIYYDVLCLKHAIEELGCAIFKDGRSFQLNERTTFESWSFSGKIKRIIDLQEFIDILSDKVRIYESDSDADDNQRTSG